MHNFKGDVDVDEKCLIMIALFYLFSFIYWRCLLWACIYMINNISDIYKSYFFVCLFAQRVWQILPFQGEHDSSNALYLWVILKQVWKFFLEHSAASDIVHHNAGRVTKKIQADPFLLTLPQTFPPQKIKRVRGKFDIFFL